MMDIAQNEPVGVLLLNLGGPDSLDAVKPFLRNLFRDREIIKLPGGPIGQAILSRIIVRARLKKVKENYASIGGKSPILELTNLQASALESDLHDAGIYAMVRPAMRYWHPYTNETLQEMRDAGIRRIVALTMYPHYSMATTGSSVAELNRVIEKSFPGAFDVSYIEEWPILHPFLAALAHRVEAALSELPIVRRGAAVVVFSAHGLPIDFIERGDPYVDHIKQTIQGVIHRVTNPPQHVLAYQSRVGPVKWLEPTTPNTMRELAGEGVRDVVIVPISFVTDHIETLEEIDRQFGHLAQELGIATFRRTEALNDDPLFISGLSDMVREHMQATATNTDTRSAHNE
jgi:protoporphyrin/coproporphyrin ferrochelatase